VELFDPASTREGCPIYITSGRTAEEKPPPTVPFLLAYFPCVWLCLNVILPVVARQRLGKQIPGQQKQVKQQKNCWTHRFQYGPCPVKGK
jgi:hypothetical protein